MLRCNRCGGHAQAGLAHLHGDPTRPLCDPCTKFVLAEREERKAELRRFLSHVRSALRPDEGNQQAA